MASPSINRCNDWALVTASPLALTKQVVGSQSSPGGGPPTRPARSHAGLLVEPTGQRRRERGGCPRQAQIGPADTALGHEGGDDLSGDAVDRNGQADADAGHCGIDAHDLTRGDDKRPARVSRIQRRVGLNDVVDDAHVVAGSGRQRATQRTDHAGGDGAGQTEWIPDRHDELSHPELRRLTQLGGRRGDAVGTDHGQVGQGIGADDAERGGGAVGEGSLASLGLPDHVCVGSKKPSFVNTTAEPAPAAMLPSRPAPGHLQRRHPRGQMLGDRHDDLGVRVECRELRFGERSRVSVIDESLLQDYFITYTGIRLILCREGSDRSPESLGAFADCALP